MGYTTEFEGIGFWTEPPLRPEHKEFINRFAETRHVTLDVSMVAPGPTRAAVGLDAGHMGANVLDDDTVDGCRTGDFDHLAPRSGRRTHIIDNNRPPPGVPGLWCQWVVVDSGHIHWDGNEKFYNYEEWLTYLVETYLKPWGYVLNGTVAYQGEDADDFGRIIVADNEVRNVFQWRGE